MTSYPAQPEQRIDPYTLPTHSEVVEAFAGDSPAWHEYTFNVSDPIYEQLTQEYVTRLATFLVDLASEIRTDELPTRVVEIGAGVGRLSHWLGGATEGESIEFVATDSGQNRLEPIFPVIEMSYEEALSSLKPDIVICSWMPLRQDWSAAIRKTAGAQAYVLIGETSYGCVGADETWDPSLYEGDQFTAEIIDCGPQINRLVWFGDVQPGDTVISTSSTVLFRRQCDPSPRLVNKKPS